MNRLMVQSSGANYNKKETEKKRKEREKKEEKRGEGKGKGKEKKEVEKEGLRRLPVRLLVDAVFASLVAARHRL
jgi:hypothetical protein